MQQFSHFHVRLLYAGISAAMGNWNHHDLSAPFWRIYWNRNRGNFVFLDDKTVELTPQKLVVIPANTPFATRSDKPADHFHVHFTATAPYDRAIPAIHVLKASKEVVEIKNNVLAYIENDQTNPALTAALNELIYLALRQLPPESFQQPYTPDKNIQQIIDQIDPLTKVSENTVLAKKAGMNRTAFIRSFKRQNGLPPRRYILTRRIEKACELLHFSNRSIDQIADECGFCDRHYFSRIFKKLRGIGPAEFRKMRIT